MSYFVSTLLLVHSLWFLDNTISFFARNKFGSARALAPKWIYCLLIFTNTCGCGGRCGFVAYINIFFIFKILPISQVCSISSNIVNVLLLIRSSMCSKGVLWRKTRINTTYIIDRDIIEESFSKGNISLSLIYGLLLREYNFSY